MTRLSFIQTVILTLAITGCSSQKKDPDFTLQPAELVRINQYNIDQFDSYISKRTYALVRKSEGSLLTSYVYESTENGKTNTTYYTIAKGFNSKNECKQITFMKAGNENYSGLKEALTKDGYEFLRTTTLKESPSFLYAKDGIMIRITPAANSKGLLTITVINARLEPYELNF